MSRITSSTALLLHNLRAPLEYQHNLNITRDGMQEQI